MATRLTIGEVVHQRDEDGRPTPVEAKLEDTEECDVTIMVRPMQRTEVRKYTDETTKLQMNLLKKIKQEDFTEALVDAAQLDIDWWLVTDFVVDPKLKQADKETTNPAMIGKMARCVLRVTGVLDAIQDAKKFSQDGDIKNLQNTA